MSLFNPEGEPSELERKLRLLEAANKPHGIFPSGYAERKAIPIFTGVLDYFPAALIEVAKVSHAGNEQHNPGQPLHHARGKSMNQLDTALRHAMDSRYADLDSDGQYHLAKAIWRLSAELQILLESKGAPLARGARNPEPRPLGEILTADE